MVPVDCTVIGYPPEGFTVPLTSLTSLTTGPYSFELRVPGAQWGQAISIR